MSAAAVAPREYGREIIAALALDRPRDTVERVKDVVITELQAVDRDARIHSTDFFNHSFAPDLVLSWRRPERERYVYLRFNEDLSRLAAGLDDLRATDPMVFGLTHTPREEGPAREQLEAAALNARVLVTDPDAYSVLIRRGSSAPVVSLMSSGITRGGRGLLDEDAAERASEVVAAGFDGARELSADRTGRATQLLTGLLDEREAGQMTRFLEAIWVGSGGRSDLFPGRPAMSGDLNDSALDFLLNFDEIDDVVFWHRLAHAVTVEQLGRLTIPDGSSANLGHLVRANLDRLWAKGCLVVKHQDRLDEASTDLTWGVDRRLLALRGRDFTAYLSERIEAVRGLQRGAPTPGIAVETLRTRARGMVLSSLGLTDGKEALVLDSETKHDVAQGERVGHIASAFSTEARVRQATATLAGGQELNLYFETLVAAGNTASKPLIANLLQTALPLFLELSQERRDELDAFLTVPAELRPASLFDEPLLFDADEVEAVQPDAVPPGELIE